MKKKVYNLGTWSDSDQAVRAVHSCNSCLVLLAYLKARLRFRIGGSKGLIGTCLRGIHSVAIELIAVFILSA